MMAIGRLASMLFSQTRRCSLVARCFGQPDQSFGQRRAGLLQPRGALVEFPFVHHSSLAAFPRGLALSLRSAL